MSRAFKTLLFVFAFAATVTAAPKPPLTFEISFPKDMSAAPLDGHILLLISNDPKDEPRFQIGGNVDSQQMFGVDVDQWVPGSVARVDAKTIGFPVRDLSDIPAGDYTVQAVLNIYETFHLGNGKTVKLPPDKGEGQHWQTKPGNLMSAPAKIHLDPAAGGVVKITLDKKIPPIEQQEAAVDSTLDWYKVTDVQHDDDNQWVKHVRIESPSLTKFWGRPTYVGAVILLPDGWAQHPDSRYPMIVYQDHYHRHFNGGTQFRSTPPNPKLKDGDADQQKEYAHQQSAYKFFQDWTSDRLPHVIIVQPQHPTPYFDDSYAVNSANQGPYGDAIQHELLPQIEKDFHAIPDGWAHATYGGSTGGWEALATQVFYPDDYNGAWVACPDVIDFRAYGPANIYQDKNAFYLHGEGLGTIDEPEERTTDGHVRSTMEMTNRYEYVLGTHDRSGEQWDIWEATFSPMGDDGYPKRIFDKLTGKIDPSVPEYWKQNYDLSAIMKRDWKTLAPNSPASCTSPSATWTLGISTTPSTSRRSGWMIHPPILPPPLLSYTDRASRTATPASTWTVNTSAHPPTTSESCRPWSTAWKRPPQRART
jgi:Putative esterase.